MRVMMIGERASGKTSFMAGMYREISHGDVYRIKITYRTHRRYRTSGTRGRYGHQ